MHDRSQANEGTPDAALEWIDQAIRDAVQSATEDGWYDPNDPATPGRLFELINARPMPPEAGRYATYNGMYDIAERLLDMEVLAGRAEWVLDDDGSFRIRRVDADDPSDSD